MRDYFRWQSEVQLPSAEYNFRPRNTSSIHGIQLPSTEYNFRPRNTTSVHGRELPSTSALPQYLIHCFQHEWAKKSNWSDYTCTWRPWNFETFVFIGDWLVIFLKFFLLICRLIRFWILHSINNWFLRQRAFIDEARGKFREHKRCARVARRLAVSNSSFLSALQTFCVLHRWTHNWSMNQVF